MNPREPYEEKVSNELVKCASPPKAVNQLEGFLSYTQVDLSKRLSGETCPASTGRYHEQLCSSVPSLSRKK